MQMETGWSSGRRGFIRSVAEPGIPINLPLASLFLASEEYPELDIVAYLGRISLFAKRVRQLLPPRRSTYALINAVNRVLYEEEDFLGNARDYYDPRNSFLSDVLDRRIGIPISLSVLYQEVARQCGCVMRGVAMPGHFLLVAGEGRSEIYVDAFNRGSLLSRRECIDVLTGGRKSSKTTILGLTRRFLTPVGSRAILTRMLDNLKLIYVGQKDYPRALSVAERLLVVNPTDLRTLKETSHFQALIGDASAAAESLETLMRCELSEQDLTDAGDKLKEFRNRAQ